MLTIHRFFSCLLSFTLITFSSQWALSVSGPTSDLSPKTREYLKVLAEGAEGESLVDLYMRVSPYFSKALKTELEPYLKDKGHLPAAKMSVDGNVVNVIQNTFKLSIKIENKDGLNVVSMNDRMIPSTDFQTVKGLMDKMEAIIKEDSAKAAKRTSGLIPTLVFGQKAHASFDFMTVALTGMAGAALGYGFGGTSGMAMGAGAGILGGMLLSNMMSSSSNTCTTMYTYWNGSSCQPACAGSGSGTIASVCPPPSYASAPVRLADPTPRTVRYLGSDAGVAKPRGEKLKPLPANGSK